MDPLLTLLAATILLLQSAPAAPREVQSLDDPWQIVFDPDNLGRGHGWFREAAFPTSQQRKLTFQWLALD